MMRFSALALTASLAFAASASPVSAQTAGAVSLVAPINLHDVSVGVVADLGTSWHRDAIGFRLGGTLGVIARTAQDGATSTVLMPFAVSAALVLGAARGVAVELRARLGAWAGATDRGIAGGLWTSAGPWLRISIGARAAFAIGADFIAGTLFGNADVAVAPGIGLTWSPE